MYTKTRAFLSHKVTVVVLSVFLVACVAAISFMFAPLHSTKAASASTLPVACYAAPELSEGDTGSAVKYLQEVLNNRYREGWFPNAPRNFHPLLTVDGIFGSLTYNAVVDIQTAKHIGVDGIVGPYTWNALVPGCAVG